MTQQETKQMDQDKIMQRYQEYKQIREARQQEEKQLQQAKTETQALWETKKNLAGKQVTTRKAHVCNVCKRTIQPGEQATVKAVLTNVSSSGYTAGFQTTYTCSSCKQPDQQTNREDA